MHKGGVSVYIDPLLAVPTTTLARSFDATRDLTTQTQSLWNSSVFSCDRETHWKVQAFCVKATFSALFLPCYRKNAHLQRDQLLALFSRRARASRQLMLLPRFCQWAFLTGLDQLRWISTFLMGEWHSFVNVMSFWKLCNASLDHFMHCKKVVLNSSTFSLKIIFKTLDIELFNFFVFFLFRVGHFQIILLF